MLIAPNQIDFDIKIAFITENFLLVINRLGLLSFKTNNQILDKLYRFY